MSESEEKKDTITIKKADLWKYSTFILAGLLVIGAFMYYSKDTGNPTGAVVANEGNAGNAPAVPTSYAQATVDDDAVLGEPNAPVTIIEFSDYQCPYCRKFWTETFSELKKNFIDTGKAKFVYRDFPLENIHPAAMPAAQAAECVREKGGDSAYFKMHDKIFEEGNILDSGDPKGAVTSTANFGPAELKKWAKEIGYDIGTCLDSEKFKSEVEKDIQDGSNSGVEGTPAFFVNGKMLSGALPYSAFKEAIEAEL